MQDNPIPVKPADAIGPIGYPSARFEDTAIAVVGIAMGVFVLVSTINMITGSLSKTLLLIISAVVLVCALYALFRALVVMAGWLARHPRLSTAGHLALVFAGALMGFALMAGGK